ncbi:MAG: hypothetical protein RL670_333 [Actinomycetota bacterium]
MNEQNLIHAWHHAYSRIIYAQLAPTGLLITTVALLQFGLGSAAFSVRAAAVLILLASGILGALAEYAAADEATAIATQLAATSSDSPVVKRIAVQARLLPVVKYLTPAIFVVIFVYLVQALLFGAASAA